MITLVLEKDRFSLVLPFGGIGDIWAVIDSFLVCTKKL